MDDNSIKIVDLKDDYLNFKKLCDESLFDYLPEKRPVKFISSNKSEYIDCENTPFATNPRISISNFIIVCYNEGIISSLALTKEEQYAMILHEIMHYYCDSTIDKTDQQQIEIEKECDTLAVYLGYTESLFTGLIKLKQKLFIENLEERINALSGNVFIRPRWTCGRFNSHNHVAIVYNLLSSNSYFFDGLSADVIGYIINTPRGENVDYDAIIRDYDVDIKELDGFFKDLSSEKLLIPCDNEKYEEFYRKEIQSSRKPTKAVTTTAGDIGFSTSDAELLYFEAVKKPGIATSVMMELTYRCSERCIHCYNPGATRNSKEKSYREIPNELNFEDYKRIIDDLYDNGIVRICLTGGDPFSNPNAWNIIEYLYEKGIATDVFTNGQRVHNEAGRLASYYPRIVGVSVYSGDPSIHDSITGVKGSWEKTIQFISGLSDRAVPMNIKCCIMQPNVKTYREVISLAQKYGAQPQFEVNIRESNDGDWCVKNLRLTKTQLQFVLMDENLPYNLMSDLDKYKNRKCDLDRNTCMIGVDDFSITPSGNIQPCVAFPLVFGNLKKKTWNQIMENNETLKEWLQCTMREFDKCGTYAYCSCCKPCAGLNYIEHGDYRKAAETSCYMAKIRYELLERLSKGDDLLEGKSIDEAVELLKVENIENLERHYYQTDKGMSITMPNI